MDTIEKRLLEEISNKLNGSAVLNGGFDKLVSSVDSIKQKQNETARAVEKIDDALYEPKEGVFSSLQSLTATVGSLALAVEANQKKLLEIEKAGVPNHHEVQKEVETELTQKLVTNRLKRVAGEDLEKLESTIGIAEKVKTLHWQLIVAILALVAKTIFDIVKHH